MSPSGRTAAPAWFVAGMILTIAWSNKGLFLYWQRDPLGHYAWAAFLVWLAAFKLLALSMDLPRRRLRWWVLVVLLMALGTMLDFQFLNQAALSASLTGRFKSRIARLSCYASSLGWMPFFGWFLGSLLSNHDWFPGTLPLFRFLWVLIFWVITYLGIRNRLMLSD
jgi:hypothetical protein